jgi:hypothetical protein
VRETAVALARAFGAQLADAVEHSLDLLVIGSRAEAEPGRVSLSASSEHLIEDGAGYPVLVLPRAMELSFGALASLGV